MKMEGLNLSTLETGNEIIGIIQPSYIEQIENVPEFLTSLYTEISVSSSELGC